jgi:hypothetical protein
MEESRNKAKMNWFQQIGDVGVMSKRDLQTQWEVVQRCHIVRWCGGSMSLEDKVQRHPKEDNIDVFVGILEAMKVRIILRFQHK